MRACRHLVRHVTAMAFAAFGVAATAFAAGPPVNIAGLHASLPVTSLAEQRWARVVRQQYDFSCGSAAVATLLSYHYGRPTTEAEVFERMFRDADQQKIRTHGFSMLDMKRYLDFRGFDAGGFRMGFDDIARIGVPVIGLVNTRGYHHFVVVKGIRGEEALIGDPAGGSVVISRGTFDEIWTGTALGARAEIERGRRGFNAARDWEVRPSAPLGRGLDRTGLAIHALALPGRNEFGR